MYVWVPNFSAVVDLHGLLRRRSGWSAVSQSKERKTTRLTHGRAFSRRRVFVCLLVVSP